MTNADKALELDDVKVYTDTTNDAIGEAVRPPPMSTSP